MGRARRERRSGDARSYVPVGSITVPVPVSFIGRDPEVGVPAEEHIWTVIGFWRVDPGKVYAGDESHLDTENLLTIEGPGCFRCEQPYRPALADLPCPGHPAA